MYPSAPFEHLPETRRTFDASVTLLMASISCIWKIFVTLPIPSSDLTSEVFPQKKSPRAELFASYSLLPLALALLLVEHLSHFFFIIYFS